IRTRLTKVHRMFIGPKIFCWQHARICARGEVRLRSGISQGPRRALSNDHRAQDYAEGQVHEVVGRGLSEVSADRRRVEDSRAGLATAKPALVQRRPENGAERAVYL